MTVDLTKCKPGDVCVDRNGNPHEYIMSIAHLVYRHRVGRDLYLDDGRFIFGWENPLDIVRVIPAKQQKKQPKWHVVVECDSRGDARNVKYVVERDCDNNVKIERGDK